MDFLKTLKQAVIAAVILLLLIVVAGVLYLLFFSSRHNFTDMPVVAETTQKSPFAPTPPAENAPEGVAIQAIAPTVAPGGMMSVVAATNATSRCTIKVDPAAASQTDPNLAPQMADDYGTVGWNFRISNTAPKGSSSLTITCVYRGRTGVVIGTYSVTGN